ncbi:MAG: Holliday junction branch migration protein RuvA [Patescibacteria group bacterium]
MIAYLKGQIKSKSAALKKDAWLVLVANSVGYKVFVSPSFWEKAKEDEEREIFIHTHVAEGVLDLYGFATREELEFFGVLISLSGIGPKSAMDILAKAKVADLKSAAQTGNADILSKVSGIGPKTAQKIVSGLKEKFGGLDGDVSGWENGFGEALEALIGLGYSAYQAREALLKCQSIDIGDKVKEALKILGGK